MVGQSGQRQLTHAIIGAQFIGHPDEVSVDIGPRVGVESLGGGQRDDLVVGQTRLGP